MSRKAFLIYWLLLSLASTVVVALGSAWLALQGYLLPWITPLADGTGFALRGGWIVLPSLALGFVLAWGSDFLARRSGNRSYYFAAWILVVVVISVAALALYGGACGVCSKVVCTAGGVKSCEVKLQISITFFKIYCECYNPSGWMPSILTGVQQTWLALKSQILLIAG